MARRKRRKAPARKCAGLVQSGKKRGKLKKGWKFKRGSKCPVKA